MRTEVIVCPSCNGDQGEYIAADVMVPCGECGGTGEVEIEVEEPMSKERAMELVRQWAEFYQQQRCTSQAETEQVEADLAGVINFLEERG